MQCGWSAFILALLKSSMSFLYMAGICLPLYIGTLFILELTTSINISTQLVLHIEQLITMQKAEFILFVHHRAKTHCPVTAYILQIASTSHSRFQCGHSSASTPAATHCSPIQYLLLLSPSAIRFTVSPHCHVQTPTHRMTRQCCRNYWLKHC